MILHLDRVQGDVHHVAIGADLGHFDPVADPQHVVAGQLHAGDERQQGVLRIQNRGRMDNPNVPGFTRDRRNGMVSIWTGARYGQYGHLCR